LGIGDWGLWDWGFGPKPKHPTQKPKNPIVKKKKFFFFKNYFL